MRVEDFWSGEKLSPATPEQIRETEEKLKITIPQFFRDIYSHSNGGRTDYTGVKIGGKRLSLFDTGRLDELSQWETLSSYVQDFDLDDDETLKAAGKNPESVIIWRYGFEVFTVLSECHDGMWIGRLDVTDEPPVLRKICRVEELSSLLSSD